MTNASEAELRPASPARSGGGDDAAAGPAPAVLGGWTLAPLDDFEAAAEAVLDHLAAVLPLPTWVVARVDGDDGVVLASTDTRPDFARGATFRWAGSLSARMLVDGARAVPALGADEATAGTGELPAPIGAYLGAPLCRPDGTLFGVLAGVAATPVDDDLGVALASVELLARLLSGLLAVVVQAEADARQHDRADATEMHDGVTGLGDERYWEQVLVAEESRCRRYGDRAAVVVVDLVDHDFIAAAEGPDAAQVLLRRAARVLRTESRDEDLVARVGPGTFAVLSVGADAEGAAVFAGRLEEVLVLNDVRATIEFRAREPRAGLQAAWDATRPGARLEHRRPA